MAADSGLSTSFDPSPAPSFAIAGLDMTGVGWSLRVACQIAVDDRPDGYCQLPVGHGGAHQAQPADRRPDPDARRRFPVTAAGAAAASCTPARDRHDPLAPPALMRQLPGRLRRPRGQTRSGRGLGQR